MSKEQEESQKNRSAIKRKLRGIAIVCLLCIVVCAVLYFLSNFIFSSGFKKEKDRMNMNSDSSIVVTPSADEAPQKNDTTGL